MNNILLVFLGGGLGSLARYGVSVFTYSNFKPVFPIATLISNLLSCVVLAIAMGIFYDKMSESMSLRMLLLTGFCGGFSTFSTFSFETAELIRSGYGLYAIANIIINVVVCIGIVYFIAKTN